MNAGRGQRLDIDVFRLSRFPGLGIEGSEPRATLGVTTS
jgi:hypothetical protein